MIDDYNFKIFKPVKIVIDEYDSKIKIKIVIDDYSFEIFLK